jgi:hypothetical protein
MLVVVLAGALLLASTHPTPRPRFGQVFFGEGERAALTSMAQPPCKSAWGPLPGTMTHVLSVGDGFYWHSSKWAMWRVSNGYDLLAFGWRANRPGAFVVGYKFVAPLSASGQDLCTVTSLFTEASVWSPAGET